jgi:hypothetical protein
LQVRHAARSSLFTMLLPDGQGFHGSIAAWLDREVRARPVRGQNFRIVERPFIANWHRLR